VIVALVTFPGFLFWPCAFVVAPVYNGRGAAWLRFSGIKPS
jgi:hypothetical protein